MEQDKLRRIDALVAEKVMGFEVRLAPDGCPVVYQCGHYSREVPHYTTDWSAAGRVLERMRELEWDSGVVLDSRGSYAYFSGDIIAEATAEGSQTPLAICLAALKALNVEVPE